MPSTIVDTRVRYVVHDAGEILTFSAVHENRCDESDENGRAPRDRKLSLVVGLPHVAPVG